MTDEQRVKAFCAENGIAFNKVKGCHGVECWLFPSDWTSRLLKFIESEKAMSGD